MHFIMHNKPSPSHKGFTLMEVLVATTLVAGGLTAISGVYSSAMRAAAISERYENARSLAEYKLEELLTSSFTASINQSGEFNTMSWTISTKPHETPGLVEISVSVDFTTLGIDRKVALTTLHATKNLNEVP